MDYLVQRMAMRSGQAEAQKRKYHKYDGSDGKVWLVADQVNCADNIYVSCEYEPGTPSSMRGFAGATLRFELVDGSVVELSGPWHSNAESMFEDTGLDFRQKHLTFVVVAEAREFPAGSVAPRMVNVLYMDCANGKVGSSRRGDKIAQKFANELGRPVALYSESPGGSCSRMVSPG